MPLRSFSSRDLILTQRRRLERPLLVMIWLGAVAFGMANRGHFFYVFAATLAVGVNLLAAQSRKEIYLNRLVVNICVLVATGLLILELPSAITGDTILLLSLGRYLVLIQLCKLFEKKSNRDYTQMLALSLLLMIVPAITCDKIWFAVVLLVYLSLACHTVMVFVLKRGLDEASDAKLATESGPMAPHRVAWNVIRYWPGGAIRYRLLLALVAILLTGGAVFVIAPRMPDADLFGRTFRPDVPTGFDDIIELGEKRKIYLSKGIAMRVRLSTDPPGQPIPKSAAYLRGKTYDFYARSRWFVRLGSTWTEPRDIPLHPSGSQGSSPVIVQEVSMSPTLLPTLFATFPAVKAVPSVGEVRFDKDMNIALTGFQNLGGSVRYVAHSWSGPLSDRQREYLVSPDASSDKVRPSRRVAIRGKVRRLAEQWCEDLLRERELHPHRRGELDLAIAERISRRLRVRCKYTLDLSDVDPDRDGIEDFLFHLKRGHCEYFASALTAMCQVLGVRARMATGFKMNLPDNPAGEIKVRDHDAHAWTEVRTPGGDWVIKDPTPAGPARKIGGWFSAIGNFWEDLQFLWYDKVVGYDVSARREFGLWLQDLSRRVWDFAAAIGRSLGRGITRLLATGHVDAAMLTLVIAVGAFGMILDALLWVRLITHRIQRRRTMEKMGVRLKQLKFLARLLSFFERRGLSHRPDQTPLDIALQAAEKWNLPRETLENLVALYYRLRWGHTIADDAEIDAAETQVKELKLLLSK